MSIVRSLIAALALVSATVGTASAALIGVSPIPPDINMSAVLVNYNGSNGLLTAQSSAFENYQDGSGNTFTTGSVDFNLSVDLDETTATGSKPSFTNSSFSLVGSVQTSSGTVGGLGTTLVEGILTDIGFDQATSKFDFLVSYTTVIAGLDFGTTGGIILNGVANSLNPWTGAWDDSFGNALFGGVGNGTADITSTVPEPPVWLLIMGLLPLVRAYQGRARARKG